jgi:hypothetical protein
MSDPEPIASTGDALLKPEDNTLLNASTAPEVITGKKVIGRPFEKGNTFGKGGNPHAAEMVKLRHAMYAAVSAGDIEDVIKACVKQAKRGSERHSRLVLEYVLGKPVQQVEATVHNLDPAEVSQRIQMIFGLVTKEKE